MNSYSHIKINEIQGDIKRKKFGGGKYDLKNRDKSSYVSNTKSKASSVIRNFNNLKEKFKGVITPSLIFELEINQSVDPKTIEKILSSMDIQILSYAENKQGYWVVFSSDENLAIFKSKLEEYGSEDGNKYEYFNAFENLIDIPKEEKIGNNLKSNPLSDASDFVDIELWRMTDVDKNKNFINELKQAFPDFSTFRITDTLITKSFVLLRVKLTKVIFDEIIELKEIARIDRPSIPDFNPYGLANIDVNDYEFNSPEENASGILIIDSGITSNHPFLEKCVGDEANFQTGESETNDTVGHGTAVAGCAVYGDLEEQIRYNILSPSNWLFSAKIMYAEKHPFNGQINARYDPEKLVENQLKEAIEYFLNNPNYNINVVNLSIGDNNLVWHKDYFRQLPLASLIDEIAFSYPNVTFVISSGNKNPFTVFNNRTEIYENYPSYFIESDEFNIINPATSALALTVGSIAQKVRVSKERYGVEDIKLVVAEENHPSPFTRTGPGMNNMIKPEIVEYGGNQIFTKFNVDDVGSKLLLLNNSTTDKLLKFDIGTSYSTPKISNLVGRLYNYFPHSSSNFIKNLLLSSADYPLNPKEVFTDLSPDNAKKALLDLYGYGLPNIDKAIASFDNRVLLFNEGKLKLDELKVYKIPLPEIFFSQKGIKRITITLTFTPETRSSRGDSYLGNRMEFHLFHTIDPNILLSRYSELLYVSDNQNLLEELKKYEIKISGSQRREAGCHQKACKEFKKDPHIIPTNPLSLVLLNKNKWITDVNRETPFCVSVLLEHEKEIDLYNNVRSNLQTRSRIR